MAGIEKSSSSTTSSSSKKKPTSNNNSGGVKKNTKTNSNKPAPKAKPAPTKTAPKDTATLSKEKPGKAPAGMVDGFNKNFAKPGAKNAATPGAPATPAAPASPATPGQADPRQNVGDIGGLSINTAAKLKLKGSGSPVDSAGVVQAMGNNNALSKGGAQQFDPSKFQGVVPSDPGAPFTGSGATGRNVMESTMPVTDMAALGRHKQAENDITALQDQHKTLKGAKPPAGATPEQIQRFEENRAQHVKRNEGQQKMSQGVQQALGPTYSSYQNPMAGSSDPKVNDPEQAWTPAQREQQAKLLLQQPINTLHQGAYGDKIPTRAEVIDAAAKKYNLDPKVLGGVLLHEQRDQSRREDAADIGGARLGGGNTSIGLGQVTMGTAMKNKNDLFADTVPDAKVRENLTHDDVAKLLTSDEHNIFAAARYMRGSADKGQTLGAQPNGLSEIKKAYPGFNPNSLSGSKWNADTIKAMAGDYSANSFNKNQRMHPGYPEFVNVAVDDIARTGIFK